MGGSQPGNKLVTGTLARLGRTIAVDGESEDWSGVKPLWQEAGGTGRGSFGKGIDVKQVRFATDEQNLYIFIHCSPSVSERFKETQSSGDLCTIYFDTDANSSTGCKEEEGFDYGPITGYDVKVWVPLGVSSGPGQPPKESVSCWVTREENGEFSGLGDTNFSDRDSSKIAHGTDGVELVLPLSTLGIKPNAKIRVLLSEATHPFKKIGYSEGVLKPR